MKKIFICICLALMLTGCAKGDADYTKANEKTMSMTDYAMTISTVVTLDDNGQMKQSAIDQVLQIEGRGKKNMIYNVATVATTTDVSKGDVTSEENSYMFFDNSYYYTYPGVRYKSPVEYEMAQSNIDKLTNVISFSEEQMLNMSREETDGCEIISYQVNYNDVSDFVKSVLENAVASFETVSFSPGDISASAVLEDGAVIARDLYIEYESESGDRITVEISAEYIEAEKLEAPDESKYVNIAG